MSNGGKREGAGRPPDGKKPKIRRDSYVDEKTDKALNKAIKKGNHKTLGRMLDADYGKS